MTSRPPKRRSLDDDDDALPLAKRQRNGPSSPEAGRKPVTAAAAVSEPTTLPTSTEELMRDSLRRSIALTLDHVGFDSSSGPALERLTEMTEEYLFSLIADVKFFAMDSRRTLPIPTDYDHSLKRFNLGTSLLRPHVKTPIRKSKLIPKFVAPAITSEEEGALRELPLLGEELSGRPEKESKSYIPSSFPDFPSIHTYKATPQDLDEVTIHGTGLKWSDGTPILTNDAAAEDHWKAGPRGDPRKMREASSRESKQAEEALRGVVRASKINQLKEARVAAQRNDYSRQRYDLWDGLMRGLIEESLGPAAGAASGAAAAAAAAATAAATTTGAAAGGGAGTGRAESGELEEGNGNRRRIEIADHSMIVNAQKIYHRQEVHRTGKRTAAGVSSGGATPAKPKSGR